MMKAKRQTVSLRPSPLASIMGIIGLIVILVLGGYMMYGAFGIDTAFLMVWVLFGIGGIVYFVVNLTSFSKSDMKHIPLTADEVIDIAGDDPAPDADFETKLRKIEALKKDGLLSEQEYRRKRDEILNQKW